MRGQQGATLLEVILAVVIIVIAVLTISLVFPKSSATLVNTRQRWLANNFAASRMQEFKTQPYALIPVTEEASITAANCDCQTDTLANIPADGVFMEDGVSYSRQVCINFVSGPTPYTSYCPDPTGVETTATDHGLKNIRIRVSWSQGNKPSSTEMEGLATR